MNLIERVKNILITPKTEWDVIHGETATPQSLLMGYVLPLSLVAAVGSLLKGFLFAGVLSLKFFIITAVIAFIASILAYYITVIIVDMLAPSFGSEKDMGKSAQLVAYSGTPSYIGGLLSFIPVIGWIVSLAAWVYGVYLMYLGIGPLKKTPEDKKVVYMIVAFLIMIVLYFILVAVLGAILFAALGMSAGGLF
ncbi:MAG: Yip1 family protein [Ferruginibacter sp.]|nr:YIP1 family protein [Chitinophagaceae bacterium]